MSERELGLNVQGGSALTPSFSVQRSANGLDIASGAAASQPMGFGIANDEGGLSINAFPVQVGLSWYETRPAGDQNGLWSTAVDGTGRNMMVTDGSPGRVWLSSDFGANWTETRPAGNANFGWKACAMSRSGAVLVAVVYGGRAYRSVNGGTNWSEVQPAGAVDKDWTAIALSGDGSAVLLGVMLGRLYHSLDSGAAWHEERPDGDRDTSWNCASLSSDGAVGIVGQAVNYDGRGRVFVTSNAGGTWGDECPEIVDDGPVTNTIWSSCAASDDGSRVVATESRGILIPRSETWTSTDGGATWQETFSGEHAWHWWTDCALSARGSTVLIGWVQRNNAGGGLGLCLHFTWPGTFVSQSSDEMAVDLPFVNVAMNATATRALAACAGLTGGGRLYRYGPL